MATFKYKTCLNQMDHEEFDKHDEHEMIGQVARAFIAIGSFRDRMLALFLQPEDIRVIPHREPSNSAWRP